MSKRWTLSTRVNLRTDRIPASDGARQQATAAEICTRLNDQPGVILADDVGMGKTFVALAVATSVIQLDPSARVVIMVPSAVGDKWPKDWSVFKAKCLTGGADIRATPATVSRGSELMKLLDMPAGRHHQIIFLTHRALSANLDDPFIKLALIREAFLRQEQLAAHRHSTPRWANRLLDRPSFDQEVVAALLEKAPSQWRAVWKRFTGEDLHDDPVPAAILDALHSSDLATVRELLAAVPLRDGANTNQRLKDLRQGLKSALNVVWKKSLGRIQASIPLLILDEAHHLKNPNKLRSLFDADEGAMEDDLRGALAGKFGRMLLMTATPFQLGHRELIKVLSLFGHTRSPAKMLTAFDSSVVQLAKALDTAQAASIRLERAWGRLTSADLAALGSEWLSMPPESLSEPASSVAAFAQSAERAMGVAREALRPWVVRHTKDRNRHYRPGAATHPDGDPAGGAGLPIERDSVLPFLLAARAQAYVAASARQERRDTQALFAEGLSSSYEAYLATRQGGMVLDDREEPEGPPIDPRVSWYLARIGEALPPSNQAARATHPKVAATIARAIHHWNRGEKVLVFCFYRATGRALREHLSQAVGAEISRLAATRHGIDGSSIREVFDALRSRADILLRRDRPGGERVIAEASAIALDAGLPDAEATRFAEIVLRFMRTPLFLVRYVDLEQRQGDAAVHAAFDQSDDSGISLRRKMKAFATRLAGMTLEESGATLEALERMSTGTRSAGGVSDSDPDLATDDEALQMPSVQLANGETDPQQRHRVMAAFNSPFLPEILIASSVMAEGVDLHRECRHVIHHDLDWSPSTLEQRTGRIDRLGSKALLSGKPIIVCEPFVQGTQDEKMYRVVKEREKWFGVVMGGSVPREEWATDQLAGRMEVPQSLVQKLMLDLSVSTTDSSPA
jgi:ERCC4-related helicase